MFTRTKYLILFTLSLAIFAKDISTNNMVDLEDIPAEKNSIEVLGPEAKSSFDFQKGIKKVADFLENNPNIVQEYYSKLGIIDPLTGLRLDLFIFDYIDELSHLFVQNRFRNMEYDYKRIVGKKPLESFPNLYKWLSEKVESNKALKEEIEQIVPQLYSYDGKALPVERKFLKKGRFKRAKKVRRINFYNQIAFDPEGVNILRYLRDQEINDFFLTPGLTVSKFRHVSKRRIRSLIKSYQGAYQQTFINGFINKESPFVPVSVKERGMTKRSNIIIKANKDAPEIVKKELVPLFNAIYKRSDKYEIFNLIEDALNLKLPKAKFMEREFPVLTPNFLSENLKILKPLFKSKSWDVAIESGNDQVLLFLRKWMKSNRQDIESKLSEELKSTNSKWRKNRLPSRALALKMYGSLESAYPDSPWVKDGDIVFDENGRKIQLGAGRFKRAINGLGEQIKNIFSVRGILSVTSASVVMALTGNPFASSAVASLTYDMIYAKKYGYKFARYLRTNSIMNLTTSMIFAAGFQSGEVAKSVFLGGVSGAAQAYFSGRSVRNGFIIGGIFEGILTQLPIEVTKWVVPGENKMVENALLELAEEAVFSSIKGGIMAGVEDGNIIDGAIDGAIYGPLIEALPRILFFGPRYDAASLVTDQDIEEYNIRHNTQSTCRRFDTAGNCISWSYIMRDRYGDDFVIELKADDLKRYTYRRSGIVWMFMDGNINGFYFPVDGTISMKDEKFTNVETILHEAGHAKQHEVAGYFYFLASPILGAGDFLNGGTVSLSFWEEYIYLPMAMLPEKFGSQIIAIPVLKKNQGD